MSTEVSASETATELVLPTVHPEVAELVHKPEDIWKRRRVLIRDIICTRKFSVLFSFHDQLIKVSVTLAKLLLLLVGLVLFVSK